MVYKTFQGENPSANFKKQPFSLAQSLDPKRAPAPMEPPTYQYSDLMKAFNKVFISHAFNFNNTSRGHVTLRDRTSGLRFKSSLNQDQSMCFQFTKKHRSHRDKAFSFKTGIKLDSIAAGAGQGVNLVNTNFFNFHQETSSFDDLEALWFQSRLALEPQHVVRGG